MTNNCACNSWRNSGIFVLIFSSEWSSPLTNLYAININANDLFVKEIHNSLHNLFLSQHTSTPLYDDMINRPMPFINRGKPDFWAQNTLNSYHSFGNRSINESSLPYTALPENLISWKVRWLSRETRQTHSEANHTHAGSSFHISFSPKIVLMKSEVISNNRKSKMKRAKGFFFRLYGRIPLFIDTGLIILWWSLHRKHTGVAGVFLFRSLKKYRLSLHRRLYFCLYTKRKHTGKRRQRTKIKNLSSTVYYMEDSYSYHPFFDRPSRFIQWPLIAYKHIFCLHEVLNAMLVYPEEFFSHNIRNNESRNQGFPDCTATHIILTILHGEIIKKSLTL